jgi:L-rhamnose-H+ transport protein
MNPFLGVLLHAIGGFAAGSFYIPYKSVRKWAWESYWIVGGIVSWLVLPWIVAFLVMPDVFRVLANASPAVLAGCFGFGALWGVGGLTFGMTMRYLGVALGYAMALGVTMSLGTLIPPIAQGTLGAALARPSGVTTVLGVLIALAGVAISGYAGMVKEREGAKEESPNTEFNFRRGVVIALLAGTLSACMAFALAVGDPLKAQAVQAGVNPLFQSAPVHIPIFTGGLLVNAIYCFALNARNQTGGDYRDRQAPLLRNYLLSALAGTLWYLQFMFYGMGESQMGEGLKFSSWTLHMTTIIVFSTLWGFAFREWAGASAKARRLVLLGIAVLVASTAVVGYGNYLDAHAAGVLPAQG